MEKSCPLSEMHWQNELDAQTNDPQLHDLKEQWNSVLGECKGRKVSKIFTSYQRTKVKIVFVVIATGHWIRIFVNDSILKCTCVAI